MSRSEQKESDRFVLLAEEGVRLDQLLTLRYGKKRSRSYLQQLILEGRVRLGGRVATKKGEKVACATTIEIDWPADEAQSIEPEPMALAILYEDRELLCLNKPAGLLVHPAPSHYRGTLVNGLLHHLKGVARPYSLKDPTSYRPGIVHRLDKDSSGLLVVAKQEESFSLLVEQFQKRQVDKKYLAICVGNPTSCTIDAPIGRHPHDRQKMAIVPIDQGGKRAVTLFEPLYAAYGVTLVLCKLITGRTHQIRLHLRHRGTPLLGDSLYGDDHHNERLGAPRQLLHAWRLRLTHPSTGLPMAWEAPLPADMEQFCERYLLPYQEIASLAAER